jgi:DNA-binding NarL/FixJ family response regulator
MAIRVLLADDHAHVRAALRDLLRKDPEMEVVGEAADGQAAAEMTRELTPDVVLMDLSMPVLSGIQATRLIVLAGNPGTRGAKVIAVSLHADARLVAEAFASGVRGYLLKNNVVRELVPAIRAVLAGELYLSGKLPISLLGQPGAFGDMAVDGLRTLTDAERDVLRLLVEGRTEPDIGRSLNLSATALRECRRAILAKLRLHTPAHWGWVRAPLPAAAAAPLPTSRPDDATHA